MGEIGVVKVLQFVNGPYDGRKYAYHENPGGFIALAHPRGGEAKYKLTQEAEDGRLIYSYVKEPLISKRLEGG